MLEIKTPLNNPPLFSRVKLADFGVALARGSDSKIEIFLL